MHCTRPINRSDDVLDYSSYYYDSYSRGIVAAHDLHEPASTKNTNHA